MMLPDQTSPYYLLIGLGNPGREFRHTRHNIGFMVIDKLAADLGLRLTKVQSKAIFGLTPFEDKKLILAKPQTYMNLSGQSVSSLLRFYRVPLEQMLIFHDDIDLPVGTIRIRPGGGSAGRGDWHPSSRSSARRLSPVPGSGWDDHPDAWKPPITCCTTFPKMSGQ